tara:strand:- start:374 stop:805 length:432 start_codon:yes stop_codon:yes gene_type:complete
MSTGESFIRWQNIRISQLGFANNLVIGITIALLGFTIDFIQGDNISLNYFQKLLFWIGCFTTLASIGIGLSVVLNRLDDFKLTAQIARKRNTVKLEGIENERAKAKLLGRKTWNLFIWQVSTFIVGFLLLLILVLIELRSIIT